MRPAPTDDPEIWLPIKGYKQFYEVSNHGRVRRIRSRSGRRACIYLQPHRNDYGYWMVNLIFGTKRYAQSVARLVLTAFHGDPPFPGATASHIVSDLANNRWDNLLWESLQDNIARKKLNPNAATYNRGRKMSEDQVREARRRWHKGESHHDLAEEFGITSAAMFAIVRREVYRRVI